MLKPVYALVGSDTFLQLQKLQEVVGPVRDSAQRIDLDGETAELAEVLDELRTFTMFAQLKVVVVREADDFVSRYREPLERFLADYSGGTASLILRLKSLPKTQRIYKLIDKVGQVCDCAPPRDLVRWAIEQGKTAHKIALAPDAARALVAMIGEDLGRLDNELAKLALASDNGKADVRVVMAMVAFQRDQEMWNMTDELAAGRFDQAILRWRQLMQTDPSTEFRATAWLTIWLEKARKALSMKRAGRSDFEITRELRIWPAEQARAFMSATVALGEKRAARLVDLLAQIDFQSKTGVGEMADNVERFLLTVAAG